MNPSPDSQEIDALAQRFFSAFDNRDGRVPTAREMTGLLAEGAIIAKRAGTGFEVLSPSQFAEPRVDLLRRGELRDFHEWETEAVTEIQGHLAVRRSRYAKAGQWAGKPYAGSGTKFFQLIHLPEGWRILSLAWEDDDA